MSILPYGNGDNLYYIERTIEKINQYDYEIKEVENLIEKLEERQKKYIEYIKHPEKIYKIKHKKYLKLLDERNTEEYKLEKKEEEIYGLHKSIDFSLQRNFLTPIIFEGNFKSKREKFINKTETMARNESKTITRNIYTLDSKINNYNLYKSNNNNLSNEDFKEILDIVKNIYEDKFINNKKYISEQNVILNITKKDFKIYSHIKLNLLYINDYNSLFKIINELFPNLKSYDFGFFDVFLYFNLFYFLKINLFQKYNAVFNNLNNIFNVDIVEKIFNSYKKNFIHCNIFKIDINDNGDRYLTYDYDFMFENYKLDINDLVSKVNDLTNFFLYGHCEEIKNRVKEFIIFIIWLNHFINPFYNPKSFVLDIIGNINYLDFIKIIENIQNINIFNKDIDDDLLFKYIETIICKNSYKNENESEYKYKYGLDISNDLICFFEYNLD